MRSENEDGWLSCRLCACKQREKCMVNVFQSNGVAIVADMIVDVVGVPKLEVHDGLPQVVCNSCHTRLENAYSFRQLGQQTHRELLNALNAHLQEEEYVEFEELEDSSCKGEPMRRSPLANDLILFNEDNDVEQAMGLDCISVSDNSVSIKKEAASIIDTNSDMSDKDFGTEYLDESSAELDMPIKVTPRKATAAQITARRKLRLTQKPRSKLAAATATETDAMGEIKVYVCDACGNKYISQGRLTDHMKTHSGVKPYKCEICGHAFAQTQQLHRHMNTHTGNRPYKCEHCPSAFADLSTRNKHHRIHTQERPYTCPICSKTFAYTNTLKFHVMAHSGEKPFVCNICGKGFLVKYKLRNHLKIHEKRGQT